MFTTLYINILTLQNENIEICNKSNINDNSVINNYDSNKLFSTNGVLYPMKFNKLVFYICCKITVLVSVNQRAIY